uniref:AlNc14C176G8141 protein n=1 Tax=Albugo laibachii Nc14 TaxID=890382 RepID=F0WNY6_9STRA|nr:AlNc14C176G8141 [Albugo laibachii Nc14]|eukprot:CCA23029.1 AlNc14C176G8141 [Albugo laibachii Nc14]
MEGICDDIHREVVESYIYGSCSVKLNLLSYLLFYMGDILRYKATHVVLTFWSKGLLNSILSHTHLGAATSTVLI